jgi:hypothetical protein
MSPFAAVLTQIVCASWTVAGLLASLGLAVAPLPLALAALALIAARPPAKALRARLSP